MEWNVKRKVCTSDYIQACCNFVFKKGSFQMDLLIHAKALCCSIKCHKILVGGGSEMLNILVIFIQTQKIEESCSYD